MSGDLQETELLKEIEKLKNKVAKLEHNGSKNNQKERQLHVNEERFRLLVESVKDYAIFMLDTSGNIATWNEGAQRLKGYQANEIIGQHFSRFYPEEDLAWGKPAWELEVASEQGRFEDEGWRLRKDGSRFWANVIITALRDEQGVLTGFAKVTRDMTERKKAEEFVLNANVQLEKRVAERTAELEAANQTKDELLKREQAARNMAEKAEQRSLFLAEISKTMASSLDYTATLKKICQMMVPYLGDLCLVFTLEPNGLLKQFEIALDKNFTTELSSESLWESWAEQVITTGKPFHFDETGQLNNSGTAEGPAGSQPFHLKSAIAVPVMVREQVLGALLFGIFKAERRYNLEDLGLAEEVAYRVAQTLDNIRLYQQMQEAVHHREEFLSVAAHELKTPITSLQGYAQLLIRQIKKQQALDPVRVQLALESFEKQTAKLNQLVVRLLDISRLQRERLAMELAPTNLSELVKNVVSLAQAQTDKHNLIIQAPPALEALVDPIRFEQVVTNLVDNAIKYSPQGGPVEITLSLLPNQMVYLSVKDQGLGIEESMRGRIFEPFYQAHQGGYTGLGLGLYISQQIIELHQGQIEAHFPPEGGSVFTITIPLNSKEN